jgi:protein phosphatase 1 regulatory subunit 12A
MSWRFIGLEICFIFINVQTKDAQGMTPLHRGVVDCIVDAVRFLVKQGANLEVPDSDGWTAFLLACDNCSSEEGESIIKLLAEAGANLEAKTADGDTALHRACMKVIRFGLFFLLG